MHLLFIDESGTIPPKNKQSSTEYFSLGGIIIPEDLWHTLDKELALLKLAYDVHGEIKWRYFSPHNKGGKLHPLSHLSGQEKEEFKISLFNTITKFKAIRSICAIVNVKMAYSLDYVQNDNDMYWYAYKHIIERFQFHLQDLSRMVGTKINGIVICDNRQPKDDHLLRNLHQKLLSGHKNSSSTYLNLIEGVSISPSHLSVGIQFADLIAGAVYRNFAKQDDTYFNLIKPILRKSDTGIIDGYGLVKWPKEKDAVSVESDPAIIDAFTA